MSNSQQSWFGEETLLELRRQEDPRATYAADFKPELRMTVVRLFARHFVVHLLAELQKTDEILQQDYADIPSRAVTRAVTETLLARVRAEFAISEDEALPARNLFKIWVEIEGKIQVRGPRVHRLQPHLFSSTDRHAGWFA